MEEEKKKRDGVLMLWLVSMVVEAGSTVRFIIVGDTTQPRGRGVHVCAVFITLKQGRP